jgi:hydrogenase-4 component F
MTGPAQGAAGLAVALGFALLGTRSTSIGAKLCAVQAAVVAIGAFAQGHPWVAATELVEAGTLGWIGGKRLPLPLWAWAASRPKPTRGGGTLSLPLAAGATLAAMSATIPGTGLPLAVILLGILLVGSRRPPFHQALGIVAGQNGLVLAAISVELSNWGLVLVVLPLLPALAFAALWFGGARARTAYLMAPFPAAWIDAALCSLFLLLACLLPWQVGAHGALWRLDPLAAHAILLLAALAAAAAWARLDAATVWGTRLAVLAGTVLAVLSSAPLLTWLGVTLATAGAVAGTLPGRALAWRRLVLGCTGLGLALFGTIALHAAPPTLSAAACAMLGYSVLGMLAPELAVAAVVLILRLRVVATDDLLLALGLAGILVAAIGLATSGPHRRFLELVTLAQGGAAVFAFGLGTDGADLAGLLQLSLLALSWCALLLGREGGLDRLAALAGLAGVPPFGLFPSLALILAATAAHAPWLLLPLGAGFFPVAWAVLRRLPAAERRLLPSPAWIPLALLLIAGFAMPDPWLAWLRLAAR